MIYAEEYGFFFNSSNSDRVYSADSFESWISPFWQSGVFPGCLEVSAGSGLNVSVAAGYANLNGKTAAWSAAGSLALAAPSGTYGRIDAVVVRRDNVNRYICLDVVTGTASASPVAPAPTRNNDVYELVLAYVAIAAGATSIASVTDKRADPDVCGYVASTLENLDTHLADYNNPHQVTAAQAGAAEAVHSHDAATTGTAGFMSAADKSKLNGIAANANAYTHPAYTARSGKPTSNQTPGFGDTVTLSQVTSDNTGHVNSMTDRTIKFPNTTATSSRNGLMTSTQAAKLAGLPTFSYSNGVLTITPPA